MTQSTELWRHRKTWLVIVAAAVLVAVADAGQTSLIRLALGRPPLWTSILLRDLAFWMTFVVWMPAVLVLAHTFRLAWPIQWGRVLIHIIGGSSFALIQIASATLLDPMRPRTPNAFRLQFLQWVTRYSALDFLAYWAVVAAFYTIHYYQESRHRAIAAARLETSLSDARLQALRAQLNPHFLFNTLNTIAVLVRKDEPKAVLGMISRLSQLLRISLDENCPQEIPLTKELEFLDGYLEIQRVRFANRLNICRDIAPDTLDALVPSMILQPVVENAVVHGVSARRGTGSITIESIRDNGALRLSVTDSGPGFGPADVTIQTGRVGLTNTQARLEQLYGARQRLQYGGSPDTGGKVTISIPFRVSAADRRDGRKE